MKSISGLLGKDMQRGNLFHTSLKDFDVDIAKENLEKVIKILNQCKVDYWLTFGTLLGCIRDEAFIPYDTDIDISCYRCQYKQIAKAIYLLEQEEFQLIRCYPQNLLVSIIRKKTYIDFYLWEEMDECFYMNGNYIRKEDAKVKIVSFLGMEVCVPIISRELLKLWYGENWRQPVSGISGTPIDRR